MNECRCDERLKTKDEESTRLSYTGEVIGVPLTKDETYIWENFILLWIKKPRFKDKTYVSCLLLIDKARAKH